VKRGHIGPLAPPPIPPDWGQIRLPEPGTPARVDAEMKSEIDHLPAKQQGELERITRILMEEFARSIERATMEWKRNGKILKIILFGSYGAP